MLLLPSEHEWQEAGSSMRIKTGLRAGDSVDRMVRHSAFCP